MKTLVIAFFLISAHLTFGQDYSDTIYYKTGMVRSGQIFRETKNTIKYNYVGNNGRVITMTARKSMLNKFTVGDENSSVASNFESANKSSLVETGNSSSNPNSNAAVAVVAVGGGIIAVVVGVGVSVVVVFVALLNSIF